MVSFGLLCAGHAQADFTETHSEEPKFKSSEEEPLVTRLEIERATGSEACPNVDAVINAIARLFPDRRIRQAVGVESTGLNALVKIRPTLAGHEAQIRVISPRVGERALVENDVNCAGLAEALAVTLVMLIESEEEVKEVFPPRLVSEGDIEPLPITAQERNIPPIAVEKTKKILPTAKAVPFQLPPQAADRQPVHKENVSLRFTVAGIGGIGLLSKPALGGLIGVDGYYRSGWGLRLSGVRLWATPANELGGSVNLTLWGTFGGPCYMNQVTTDSRINACLLLGIGAQHARVEGFTNSDSKSVLWAVVGPHLRYVAPIVKTVGGVISIGVVGQLRPQSFSVTKADNPTERQNVADAPRLGLLVELGLTFGEVAF